MIVVDASVLVTALADDGTDGDRFRASLRAAPDWNAPHLIDPEVISALRRRVLADGLDQRRAGQALGDLSALPITRYPHLPLAARSWELRENLTTYDALYVALAELLHCALVTADARLAGAPGPRCEIELLEPS